MRGGVILFICEHIFSVNWIKNIQAENEEICYENDCVTQRDIMWQLFADEFGDW
jgi:hypothetical protein